ncbi:alkaline shock response membrane anchor protein AmaP [Mammaliicoccus lentus]|uniref:alkaline shock response membrane anchor protein AmaP n=1 Tax=Mammaliicoccus lentus TaxID=42858 RepID=UPI000474A4B5|nr:alkaline shock response membrane anchor protein AmaP [Mammaliicoccus lentus]
MRRLKNFFLGLFIIVVVGTLLFMYLDISQITSYQQELLKYNWFQPTLIVCAGVLIFFGLLMFFAAFKPTHKKPGLHRDYEDGHIYITRNSIEKCVYRTIQKYDEVRQPNVIAKLYNKKNNSYATIKADFFVVSETNGIQSLTENMKNDIKQNVEHFSEIPVKNIEINVRDQKTSDTRVL